MQAKDVPIDSGDSTSDQQSTPGAATHLPGLLTLFRAVWIAGCVLTALILVVLLVVLQPSVELFLVLGGVVCALFAGLILLRLAHGSIHRGSGQPLPSAAPEPNAPSISEPACFVAADRLLFARRVHFPKRVEGDPERLIYQEGRFIQVLFLLLLFGLGVTLLAHIPEVWERRNGVGLFWFQLVIGLIFTAAGSLVFLRLRITLDRNACTATFRWGLLFRLRSEVASLDPYDCATICKARLPPMAGRNSKQEYVVCLGSSRDSSLFYDLLQVTSLDRAKALVKELTEFFAFRL